MLLVDGVKFKLWSPEDEENEFHPMVKEHSEEIFGEDAVYFDLKHKLTSRSGIASIPDAYVITLSKPYEWYIVENELASHPVYSHIIPQISKFINGIENLKSQREIRDLLYDRIVGDKVLRAIIETKIGSQETHRFLSSLISKPPRIAIIIDEETAEVKEAVRALKKLGSVNVVEFKTFVREDAPNVRAHLFTPIRGGKIQYPEEPQKKGEITSQPEYALPILESLIETGGRGKTSKILDRVFQKMRSKLKPRDLEKIPSGTEARWRNQARWERYTLKRKGYLKKDSPTGIWEITDKGRDLYQNLKGKQ